MKDNIAIEVENVSKEYRLGVIGGETLSADLQSWWARVRGKEDPNTKIGAKVYSGRERFRALDGINLKVEKGEALGIIGRNGAGKSTLLKLMSRVTAPTEGVIRMRGRVSSMLEVGTGFHPEMTGRENIYMNGAILGMDRREVDSKINEIIEFSECAKFIDTPVKRYSSGMYVKLAFAVAAHLDSDIMIMDEVLAVGDMRFQQKCLGKMSQAASGDNRSVLYVSHNMNTIRQLCTRCVVLDHGTVAFDGDVDKAIEIYMNNVRTPEATGVFTQEDKDSRRNGKVSIDGYRILGRDDCVISDREPLELTLYYSSEQGLDNVYMRVTFEYTDDTRVGTAVTPKPIRFEKTDHGQKTFRIDTIHLAAGQYTVRMTFYCLNEFGSQELVEIINRGCSVIVESSKERYHNLAWNHRWWGHSAFDDILEITER